MDIHQIPALRQQLNGWTPDRQQRFIEYLAASGSVSAAARQVGMTRQSAYWLRSQPAGTMFKLAWEAALADADKWIDDLVLDRLLNGEVEVIERQGEVVGVRRRPVDARLLIHHIDRRDREKAAREAAEQAEKEERQYYERSSNLSKLMADMDAYAMRPPPDDGEWW